MTRTKEARSSGYSIWHVESMEELHYSFFRKQHFLYFLPLPHGHGSLRPTFGPVLTIGTRRSADSYSSRSYNLSSSSIERTP
jgi:hypothetical protein